MNCDSQILDRSQLAKQKSVISHLGEKIKANHGSWNTVVLKKLVYLGVRTSKVFLCFGAIDFLLDFVWWLLFTFFTCMLLVRLVGFCTKDECKNLWLNCCVSCLNRKAQGKPLLSQYDLYLSKMTSLTGLERISGGSPDTMTGQIHFNSVTYYFWLVKLCKINNSK